MEETVTIDDEGNGRFIVHGGNVAVWIPEDAPQDPKQDARKDDAGEESLIHFPQADERRLTGLFIGGLALPEFSGTRSGRFLL